MQHRITIQREIKNFNCLEIKTRLVELREHECGDIAPILTK